MKKDIPTTVIDNWLDPQLANFMSDYLSKELLYTSGKSLKSSTRFFLSGVVPITPLIDFLIYKIQHIQPVNVLRVYTNLQYNNMEGDFHPDDGDITFLYMPSKGLNSDEGYFEIKDEEKIEYKFNRLIYFDARKLHRGHAPKQNVQRITLAFKTQFLLNKL
jgi:hypothetical protein